MCQLLGISSNKPVDINFSFKGWKHRGRHHRHGYGFAWWEAGVPTVAKDPSSLYEAATNSGNMIAHVTSKTFVCHVRHKSEGGQEIKNTHPFQAVKDGIKWVFAHNGTLNNFRSLELKQSSPVGETDSEHAFLWLLENLPTRDDSSFGDSLKKLAEEVAIRGGFNFLLSDGVTLWAYCSDSLYFIVRTPPYGGELVRLQDEGYTVGLDEIKGHNERAVIVCTYPLTDEKEWNKMGSRQLIKAQAGGVNII